MFSGCCFPCDAVFRLLFSFYLHQIWDCTEVRFVIDSANIWVEVVVLEKLQVILEFRLSISMDLCYIFFPLWNVISLKGEYGDRSHTTLYSHGNHSLFTKMWTPNNKVFVHNMKLWRPPWKDENFICLKYVDVCLYIFFILYTVKIYNLCLKWNLVWRLTNRLEPKPNHISQLAIRPNRDEPSFACWFTQWHRS